MRKTMVATFLALTLVFSVSACGEPVDDSGNSKYSDDDGVTGVIPNSSNYLKKVEVEGTTCIIFSDAAISCDWDTPSQSPTPESEYYDDGLG